MASEVLSLARFWGVKKVFLPQCPPCTSGLNWVGPRGMDHEFGSSALFDGAVEDPCKLADDDLVSCFGWAVGEATPSSSPGVGAPFGGGGGVQCPPGPHGAQRNVDEVQAQLMAAHHRQQKKQYVRDLEDKVGG